MTNYKLFERLASRKDPCKVAIKLKAEVESDSLASAEKHFRKLCNTGFVTKTGLRHIEYRIISDNQYC